MGVEELKSCSTGSGGECVTVAGAVLRPVYSVSSWATLMGSTRLLPTEALGMSGSTILTVMEMRNPSWSVVIHGILALITVMMLALFVLIQVIVQSMNCYQA